MKYLSPLFFFLTFHISNGQVIAAYSGTPVPTATTITGISATALTAGSGLTDKSTSYFEYQKWTNASVLDLNDYFEWSLTATPDFTANITAINISYNAGNKAPETLELKTSLDNFTATIYIVSISQNSSGILTIPTTLTSTMGGTITFRLFGYNSSNSNSSRFGIDGGLNTQIGLANTGITLEGSVTYSGLFYDGTTWTPNAPNNTTGADNAIISNGSYTINSDTQINRLEVMTDGTLLISEGIDLHVNEDLIVDGALELNSNSNEYSSLIVKGSVSGNVKYKRHVNITAAVGEEDANDLIAPPVSGEAFNSFLTNNSNIVSNSNNTLYLFGPFDKATGTYVVYSNTETAVLDAGTGYRAASTDGDTFTFTGAVNTGMILKPISYSGIAFKEWNLIGNPYPSYIKLSEFLDINIMQFDPSRAGIYGYDGDTSDGWTIWNKAYSDANPSAIVTPGQGFLVASKLGGGTITFNPTMRTTGNSDDFIEGRPSNMTTSYHISLSLTNDTKTYSTYLYFNPSSSRGLDIGYDANIFGDTAPTFSIYSNLVENNNGNEIAIQSLNLTDYENISIPLGVNASKDQQLTFSINKNSLPNTVQLYLEDNITNTFTPLNAGDYTLTPNTNLNGTGRFYLHLTDNALSKTDNTLSDLSIYTNHNSKKIIISGQLLEPTVINVYDLQGRNVKKVKLLKSNKSQSIDVSQLSYGFYVVELKNTSHNKTQKIILN
ncbi:T9SS type A sorting domain-containing protein [Winogradskyella sp. R77965]|uniref:T9SS type A sorting domain-containing protein n=1 Tax=Winogradskyella sp. R77965 TaxID=3093872 RepID=UPI0037DD270F